MTGIDHGFHPLHIAFRTDHTICRATIHSVGCISFSGTFIRITNIVFLHDAIFNNRIYSGSTGSHIPDITLPFTVFIIAGHKFSFIFLYLIRRVRKVSTNRIADFFDLVFPSQRQFDTFGTHFRNVLTGSSLITCCQIDRRCKQDTCRILNKRIHRKRQTVIQRIQIDTDIGHFRRFPRQH